MNTSYLGLGEMIATFEVGDNTLKKGDICEIDAYGKIIPAKKGSDFIGKVINIRNGYCSVQLKGYMKLKYEATEIPFYGQVYLAAASATTVIYGGNQNRFLVVDVDEANFEIGVIA